MRALPPRAAESEAVRVTFDGWSYLLLTQRGGLVLLRQEAMHNGRRPYARVDGAYVVRVHDKAVLGTVRDLRPGGLCTCAGCAPVGVDTGARPWTRVFQGESSAHVGTPLRRLAAPKVLPLRRLRCVQCNQPKPIASAGLCWECLAAAYGED